MPTSYGLGTLERGDLPEPAGVLVCEMQSVRRRSRDDLVRPVDEEPEVGAADPAPGIDETGSRSRQPSVAREAERECAARLLRCGAYERRHVRVAADHAVEDDHVGGRRELGFSRQVAVPPIDAAGEAGLFEQGTPLLLVGMRELDIGRSFGSRP